MFCPKCRTENPNTGKFCKACGKQLPNFAEVVARTQQYHQAQAGLVGQVLDGKYRIDAKLGAGGMGDVYRATRLLMGDTIAIKTLHTHLASDPQSAERFRREAITATKLRHKNVVTIYDVGISAAHRFPYILMELAEGYTLRQIINENKILPLDFVVTVVAQVCAALTEAHQLGIIHRDIKPENIVANQTDTGWHIKVLDFGIAKLYNQPDSDLTQDGSALGTPQYMSPEQCLGESLDARSDLYSIGITIYELLCGKPPFSSLPATAISVHQVQTPPTPPTQINPNIHPEVEKVILRILSKQREHRPQTAIELSQEFIQAATAAFKAGTKPEQIEQPSEAPISENVIEDKNNIPVENFDNEIIEDDELKNPDSNESENLENNEIKNTEDEKLENVETENTESEKSEKQLDLENLEEEAVEDISDNLETDESDEIHLEVEESELPQSEELNFLQTGSQIIDSDILEDEDEEEDLSEVYEEAERVLDDILVDSKHINNLSKEQISDNNRDSGEPILKPDSLLLEPDESYSSSNQTVDSNENYIDKKDNFQQTELFNKNETPNSNKNFLFFGGIGLLGLLIISSFIALSIWFFTGSNSSQTANANSSVNKETSIKETDKTKPPEDMAYIPGGEFMMGKDDGDEFSRPAHKVTVKPFFMDLTEVTNEEYKRFITETNYNPPPSWKDKDFPNGQARYPVTGVNWNDAKAYAKWADKRLPTEEEWEFAARGEDNRLYPWGNEWKANFANAGNKNKGMIEVAATEGKSPFGLNDMVGNAWEWTNSDAKPYPNGKDFSTESKNPKIIRGGFWGSPKENATATFRGAWGARNEQDYTNTGFRCAKSLPSN